MWTPNSENEWAELEQQQQPLVAGGGPGGDPSDDEGDDGDGDDSDDENPVPEGPPHSVARGWVIYDFTRDGGDNFYHRRLMRMLGEHYGHANVAVEYHSEWWTHLHFRNY